MQPLAGTRIVEMAGLASAPLTGMMLADMGASVIRVDKLNATSPLDNLDYLCRGKRSLALNLKSLQGVTLLLQLIRHSDILIDPYRPGVMESLGLGPEQALHCESGNPRLIYARLTGFPRNDSNEQQAGYDINYLSVSDVLSLLPRDSATGKPIFLVNFLADFADGSLMCIISIMGALIHRNQTGQGCVVNVNMVEGLQYADHRFIAVSALETPFYKQFVERLLPHVPASLVDTTTQSNTISEWSEIFAGSDACVTAVLDMTEIDSWPQASCDCIVPHSIVHRENSTNVQESIVTHTKPRLLPRGYDSIAILRELNVTEKEIYTWLQQSIVAHHRKPSRL